MFAGGVNRRSRVQRKVRGPAGRHNVPTCKSFCESNSQIVPAFQASADHRIRFRRLTPPACIVSARWASWRPRIEVDPASNTEFARADSNRKN